MEPPREPDRFRAQAADLAARIVAEARELAEAPGSNRYHTRRLHILARVAGALAGGTALAETDGRTFRDQ